MFTHLCSKFNGSLAKPPVNLGHEWVNYIFRHFCRRLHRKLSKLQLPVYPMTKMSSKWQRFRFSVGRGQRRQSTIFAHLINCPSTCHHHKPQPQFESQQKTFCTENYFENMVCKMAAMLLTLQSANPQVSSAERYLIGLYTVLLKLEETLVCKLNFNSLRPSDAYLRK